MFIKFKKIEKSIEKVLKKFSEYGKIKKEFRRKNKNIFQITSDFRLERSVCLIIM